ncbi:division/outer membrane stress-associated lipid-binding lipoprotein [Pseudaeromonas paramecii]|uniref:Division/outer membrane stress-associated lipid-binding lipoprotein n=1 Tax=Pseudaeromonas paramecii TaxID=2138166 RepID=A0ABP8QDS0_9GAMM
MKHSPLIALLTSLLLLQGCAGVIVAGAATTAAVANDRRTIGSQLDDQSIEMKVNSELAKLKELNAVSRIVPVSTNGKVLLVGQTPNQGYKDKAGQVVAKIPGVRQVYNEVRLRQPLGLSGQSNDTWLTSKIKTDLLMRKNFDSTHIKVNTEDGEVFLSGLVTRAEGETAVEITRNVSGVRKVVKVFEYVQAPAAGQPANTNSQAAPAAAPASDNGDVQLGESVDPVLVP